MSTATDPTVPTTRRPTRDDVLVTTAWLDEHLDDPRVVVVEVDVSATAHAAGHVPGAVLWNIYTDLKDPDYQLVEPTEREALVRRSGIAQDSIVVFYGYGPAMGFWLLRLHGHGDLRMLDASRETWQAERRPWTDDESHPAPSGYRLPAVDAGVRATMTDVDRLMAGTGTTILDVRTDAEFLGERFWPSGGMEDGGRAGHIPGAVHVPADGLCEPSGAFRSTEDLAAMYEPLRGDHQIVTYCTIGARASTMWFVLTYLLARDRVTVYDGSWAEWGRTPEAPVA
jgi:thiosulfate/3-mercaptopyruvate sulfurtransferase